METYTECYILPKLKAEKFILCFKTFIEQYKIKKQILQETRKKL